MEGRSKMGGADGVSLSGVYGLNVRVVDDLDSVRDECSGEVSKLNDLAEGDYRFGFWYDGDGIVESSRVVRKGSLFNGIEGLNPFEGVDELREEIIYVQRIK